MQERGGSREEFAEAMSFSRPESLEYTGGRVAFKSRDSSAIVKERKAKYVSMGPGRLV